ncbi:MPV17L2 family protein [Megaselia abdita]
MLCRKLITSAPRRFLPGSILVLRSAKTKVVPNLHGETKVVEQKKATLVSKFFGKYLLLTNTVSSGLLMIAGDVICQEIEFRRGELKERYDVKRIWQMFLVGSLQGPMHHYFYGWLARMMPQATVKNAMKKILWDQFIMSPACILMFFYPACLLEKKPFSEATQEIKDKFLTVYVTDWCVWPAAQFINFYYLPAKYNVIFVNFCTMLYNVFLSHIKHKDFH